MNAARRRRPSSGCLSSLPRHDCTRRAVCRSDTPRQHSANKAARLRTRINGRLALHITDAFRQLFPRVAAYGAGAYLANPRKHIAPTCTTPYGLTAPIAVKDEDSAHAGISIDAWRRRGLSLSFGDASMACQCATPLAAEIRVFADRYLVFAEPAMALRRGRSPVSPAASLPRFSHLHRLREAAVTRLMVSARWVQPVPSSPAAPHIADPNE